MFQKENITRTEKIVIPAFIAAIYTVMALVIPAASFGPVQFRFSEILTVLPVFTKLAIPGLGIGCFLANLIGYAVGGNVAGVWDILIGTATTCVAAIVTYILRDVKHFKLPILATIPPMIFNAVIIGLELTIVLTKFSIPVFLINASSVALGQLVMCNIGGLILYKVVNKSKIGEMFSKL